MSDARAAPLAQLTSLRFLAALLVFFSHLAFLERSNSPFLRELYDLFFRQGACGVTFFFILSGFILTHAYEQTLQRGEIPVAIYLYRRAARIFPLHLMAAGAFLGYLAIRHDLPVWRAVPLNLALLHSWFPDPLVHYSLNGPSWSLSNELFFYLLFPLLVRVDARMLQQAFLAGAIIIIAGACVAASVVDGYSPFVDWLFYAFPLTRLLEFVAGILLCRAWRAGVGYSWATGWVEALLVLTIGATMVSVEWFAIPLAFRYQLAFLPPMAALILVFAYGRGVLAQWLRSPVLQRLGEASFALYLVHRPLITFLERWSGRNATSDGALALAMLLLAVGIAIATFVLVDRSLQSWLRRFEPLLVATRRAGKKPADSAPTVRPL